ncbi:MAG: amino acid adenylation domain-containing protein [Candidatus Aminicenantes bacterium]|nr:MAG: amino acid adenylation domain-containing protein [Candidatus Aminicenantes bacterium]
MTELETGNNETGLEIAVIGMAGRFPGAGNINEFWDNLKNGRESIGFFSDKELAEADVEPGLWKNSNYVKARGVLDDMECFDASFFGYTPGEAEIMDPQMRIFHECAWEALEDAGYAPGGYKKLIGCYAGASSNLYWQALSYLSGKNSEFGEYAASQLHDRDFLCTRIAHCLDLRGQAVVVQTACSTSLVAVHLACQGLISGECDMALAGGVSLSYMKTAGYLYQQDMIFSPDGHCRAFDARANGTIFGDGVGVVVLKPLEEAIADRDHIYAMIKGSAVNNDGMNKSGYSAPGIEGQAAVIRMAHQAAGINPETISYIETHGTGTSLGDPVELEGLKLAFHTRKKQFCRLGSVKSNIGHLNAAAGIAGLIKTILALTHRLIPPSLHFHSPNPKIDFDNSPFYVNTKPQEWNNDENPLRAGVSSFGIGGTNAHVVLEEWPGNHSSNAWTMDHGPWSQGRGGVSPPPGSREYQLILLSAKTQSALDKMTHNLVNYLQEGPPVNLVDMSYTLQAGRKRFEHGKMVVVSNREQAARALSSPGPEVQTHFTKASNEKKVVFMFPGQGSQYVNMGREFYEKQPLFREEMDRCFEILNTLVDVDLKDILYPPERSERSDRSDQSDLIHQTEIAQPLLFAFEYSLAKLLLKWGITPDAMIGHSIGEYTAACLSGVFSLAEALKLVALRGKFMQEMPAGAMLSVPLPEAELTPLLNRELSLAAVNSSSLGVVSGPPAAVEDFKKELEAKGQPCRLLHTSHAFHSPSMEPILDRFKAEVSQVTLNAPRIPYLSNVSGDWITVDQAVSPAYWAVQLREKVCFARGLEKLLDNDDAIFIEVGPGKVLGTFVHQHAAKKDTHQVVHLVKHPREQHPDILFLLNKIGQLWLYGVELDWSGFYAGKKRYRVSLPTYPFARDPFHMPVNLFKNGLESLKNKPDLRKKQDMADWFYIPSWERSLLVAAGNGQEFPSSDWLVFLDECGIGSRLKKRLEQDGQAVITVKKGSFFSRGEHDQYTYTVNPGNSRDYLTLCNELRELKKIPGKIIHLWGVTGQAANGDEEPAPGFEEIDQALDPGLYSLLYLVQAIEKRKPVQDIQIEVVTDQVHEVTGHEVLDPGKAAVLGAVKVIPQEYFYIKTCHIDILVPEPGSPGEEQLIDWLLQEFYWQFTGQVMAYRRHQRWKQTFVPVKLPEHLETMARLRNEGVYLVTGGLGQVGLVLAEYLARQVKARLILTGRSAFPPRDQWNQWLTTHKQENSLGIKIRQLQNLEALGARVLVINADVSNREQMQTAVKQAEKHFGTINGVIHAAGIVGEETHQAIANTTPADCQPQFKAKIYGLLILEEIFGHRNLDFCLLTSSLASILGGLGFFAYSAANIFMDAFVEVHNKRSPVQWLSVNWDAWQPMDTLSGSTKPGITPEEGAAVFHRALSCSGTSQLAVSTWDLSARINQWIKLETPEAAHDHKEEHAPENKFTRPRPPLTTPYAAPGTPVEQTTARIWQHIFGIEKIGIYDDFFELGGDSLKAMTVTSRIHKELKANIPLAEFFKYPTISSLAKYINQAAGPYISVYPLEKKEYYPLTPAQQRLYFLRELDRENTVYNLLMVLAANKAIEKAKLETAIKQLIARHESLRTSFRMMNDQLVQQIHEKVEFEIQFLATEDTEDKEEKNYKLQITNYKQNTKYKLQNTNKKEAGTHHPSFLIPHSFSRPFDLSRAPLLRVGILKTREQTAEKHILLVDMHHIISDGISINLLINEFMKVYKGENLPPREIQYKDFAGWQTHKKQQEKIHRQELYWKNQWEGEIPVLNLPIDYPRPLVRGFAGNTLHFEIAGEKVQALKSLAREQEVTLFMLLLSVYTTFLSRLSGQEDIVVGTPTAGRRHADLENIIGMFVNTLALRNFPLGQQPFTTLLEEVKKRTLEAFENQDYPFEYLVEQVELERDTSRNPLFDTMFSLLNMEAPVFEIPGLKLAAVDYKRPTAQFDLTLTALESDQRLSFAFEYSTTLFKEESIRWFIVYFKKILEAVIENKTIKLKEIDIIPADQKQEIMYHFNNTAKGYPEDKTIHHLFADQVEQTPDHIAVVGTRGTRGLAPLLEYVTYMELKQKSGQLAEVLKEKGVGIDTIVGIMMQRSIEMIIGIFGILKAGGAYLPVDPGYPKERIDFMLKDSGAEILLKDNDLTPSHLRLPPLVNAPATSLAYVIYTSGSTGQPKGVMVEHASVVNRLAWMQRLYPLGVDDVIMQKTAVSFDVSVWELFWWSFQGARLFLLAPGAEKDPGAIVTAIGQHKVTTMHFVPSMLSAFLGYLESPGTHQEHWEWLRSLKQVFASGEALLPGQVRRFNALLNKTNQTRLINLYGPTEATVDVSYFNCPGQEEQISANIPIGKPIDNICLYILNKYLCLQPLGVPGELYIAGVGAARGYLNNPELTANKFLATDEHGRTRTAFNQKFLRGGPGAPRRGEPKMAKCFAPYAMCYAQFAMLSPPGRRRQKLYQTGDLARWLADGNIEFLGRVDFQVKIRGFRIELGEIENHLLKHPQVEEAVVIAGEADKDDKYLCAYIRVKPGGNPDVTGLQTFLSGQLPHYMIPHTFIRVESIPLTPVGKVDRKVLRSRGIRLSTGLDFVEPRDDIEKRIARTWKEILKLDQVSIKDSFFSLGGNSIKLIRLNTRIREEFNLDLSDLPMVKMFEYATISALGNYLRQLQCGGRGSQSHKESQLEDIGTFQEQSLNILDQTIQILKGEENE